jgi:outer membrane lipoprotein-sorting protein
MKKIIFAVFLLYTLSACTKSETQYSDQQNKKESVNNKASDTIRTLNEASDTASVQQRPNDIKTDNK